MEIKRRDFLTLFGGVSGSFLVGCFDDVIALPDEWLERTRNGPRVESWQNTICGVCASGCGLRVRLIDGIPVSVKGNPVYPVNKGGLCPLGLNALHFDLLPTHNFRYGSHPDTYKIDSKVWKEAFTQGLPDGCWLGCTLSCSHGVDHFPIQTGPYAGQCVLVDGPEYENAAGLGSNIGNFDPQKVLELNFYCDTYGI